MKKHLSLLLSILLFTSCYTTKPISENLNTWLGASEHDIIMRFGSPTDINSDGAGGKILKYKVEQTRTQYSPNTIYGRSATTFDNSYYTEFYINKDDKVYYWRTNLPDIKVKNGSATQGVVILLLMSLAFGLIFAINR